MLQIGGHGSLAPVTNARHVVETDRVEQVIVSREVGMVHSAATRSPTTPREQAERIEVRSVGQVERAGMTGALAEMTVDRVETIEVHAGMIGGRVVLTIGVPAATTGDPAETTGDPAPLIIEVRVATIMAHAALMTEGHTATQTQHQNVKRNRKNAASLRSGNARSAPAGRSRSSVRLWPNRGEGRMRVDCLLRRSRSRSGCL